MDDNEIWHWYEEELHTKVEFLKDEICILIQKFKIYFSIEVGQIKTQNLYFWETLQSCQ